MVKLLITTLEQNVTAFKNCSKGFIVRDIIVAVLYSICAHVDTRGRVISSDIIFRCVQHRLLRFEVGKGGK